MDPTEILAGYWGMEGAHVRPLGGGMNSETWLVEHQGSTYVAKSVSPDAIADLIAGGEVVTALAEAGFLTGRPVPTRDGTIVLTEPALALLEHVAGRDLEGETDEEQTWIASTLAGVHAASNPDIGPSVSTFARDWLSPQMPGVQDHPWLTAAIEAVRDETDLLTVTWSVLHTDPLPRRIERAQPSRPARTAVNDASRMSTPSCSSSSVMVRGGAIRKMPPIPGS